MEEEHRPSHLIVAISSDRGLCGGIHSNVAKNVKATMEERPSDSSTAIVCIGDKARIILQRTQKKNIMLSFNEVGKQPPVFVEAAFIAQQILNSGLEYQSAEVVFSKFKSVLYSYWSVSNIAGEHTSISFNIQVYLINLSVSSTGCTAPYFICRNVVSYSTTSQPIVSLGTLAQSGEPRGVARVSLASYTATVSSHREDPAV